MSSCSSIAYLVIGLFHFLLHRLKTLVADDHRNNAIAGLEWRHSMEFSGIVTMLILCKFLKVYVVRSFEFGGLDSRVTCTAT